MTYKAKVVGYLKDSLTDERCIGALLHLDSILVGKDKAGRDYYRIRTTDGQELKTIDDLISNISEDEVELRRVRVRKERFYNSLSGVRVILKNIVVNVSQGRIDDKSIVTDFGVGEKNLVFIMSYFADNDTTLPLKINYIDMVDYEREDEDDSNEGE